LNNLRS